MNGWVDVKECGAKADGTTPDTTAIRIAMSLADRQGGGVVWFPPGSYLIDSKIIIDRQMTFLGAGWHPGDEKQGSWIVSNNEGVNLEIRARGTRVENLAFSQRQNLPTGGSWTPREYEFAIHAGEDDIFLKQINLHNCFKGIMIKPYDLARTQTIGRIVLDHVWGQPLHTGVAIDNAQDVVKINNIHFWPFWSSSLSNPGPVSDYMRQHAIGIYLFRADNPQFSNIFALGYNTGIRVEESSGVPTSKLAVVNADFDYCENGVVIAGKNATVCITNMNYQGAPGNVGIAVNSEGVRLFLNNVRLTQCRGNALRASGANTRVFINNLWAELWNQPDPHGFPAVEAVDGAMIYLGRPVFFDRGNGAENVGETNGGRVLKEFNDLISKQ